MLGLLLCGGCSDVDRNGDDTWSTHPTLLADDEVRGVELYLDAQRSLSVALSYDRTPREGVAGCPSLDDSFHARVGQLELAITTRGGWVFAGADTWGCGPSRLTVALPGNVGPHQLVIADDSQERTYDLGDSLEPRAPSHPTWTFTVGEIGHVAWSHPGDLDPTDPPPWEIDNGRPVERIPLETTVVGDAVEFEVPRVPGMQYLDIHDARERSCGDTCRVVVAGFMHAPITVTL